MPVKTVAGATIITGSATYGMRALACLHSLRLYVSSGITMRARPCDLVRIASEFTGKTYGKGRKNAARALADLERLFVAPTTLDEIGEAGANRNNWK